LTDRDKEEEGASGYEKKTNTVAREGKKEGV